MLANQARIASTTANYAVLEGVHYQLDPGDFKLRWEVYGWPKKIYDKMDAVELALQKQEASYQTDMEEAQEGYREGLRSMMDEVENLRIYTDLKRVDQVGGWLCGVPFNSMLKRLDHECVCVCVCVCVWVWVEVCLHCSRAMT